MDFKVKCIRNNNTGNKTHFTVGKVYEVTREGLKNNNGKFYTIWMDSSGDNNFDKLREWFINHTWVGEFDFELVEDKKVFTKSDLKNGDVIVRRNGAVEIAIVDLNVCVAPSGWNNLHHICEDLTDVDGWEDDHEWDIVKVIRPNKQHECQFCCARNKDWGEVVYDRERDTKKPYNGKVVCIENTPGNRELYTVGKIYQFNNGQFIGDNGRKYPNWKVCSFDEFVNWTGSKFIEIKE